MGVKNNKKILITGPSGSSSAKVIGDIMRSGRQILVIVPSISRAERLMQDLSFFCDREISLLPPDEDIFIKYEAKTQEQEVERAGIIGKLIKDKEHVVIAPASGAIKRLLPREEYRNNSIEIRAGGPGDFNEIKESLVKLGYERESSVFSPGGFAIRGGIIDIFPGDSDCPVRIDFLGDTIDSIKKFDVETQRSITTLEEVNIYPALFEKYSGGFIEEDQYEYIWDYILEGDVVIEEPERIREHLALRERELWNDLELLVDKGERAYEDGKKITGEKDFIRAYDLENLFFIQALAKTIKDIDELSEHRTVRVHPQISYDGHLELLSRDIKFFYEEKYKVILTASSEGRVKTLKEFLEEENLTGRAKVISGYLSNGMSLPDEKLCYISDGDIFSSSKEYRKRGKRAYSGKPIQSFTELKRGEYVVHDSYGIGVFQGIEELTSQGITRDYIKIRYRGNGILYVPVEQMDMVQKYIGAEGKPPKISKLGSPEWKHTKDRARKAVADMTDELIALYAKRKGERGYAFSEDTVWQAEFEDSFPYQETADQMKSIEEIKEDMESPEPMDRLLCGDVGYGKTEVAARAIFKCMIEGKQAAILVPTTILASQHYDTLKDRFKGYPFTVELMSRFKTDKELKETSEKLKKGDVDLVIGTHRLLSRDVEFKDLGLLVIDEEQRFGVKHKEKIKEIKVGVDVLTLSATPIPRTLNMSLTGIRDMSLITEPPEERYPVQTYVVEQDEDLMREVIMRELDRGGQVFVVYNRIQGIISAADKIARLVPEARIGIGHGRMGENSLEEVMRKFVAGELDVLVATTIVESGLDIPNANTLIVLDADRCGLSQLYQLRGRVGRSNRIAYAYLMYQREKVLTEVAEKRLKAVREFTEFGAGFKIAMRDMELRGAGNVLGAEQSGHMLDVGYEMYARLVEEAAMAARGEEISPKRDDLIIEIKSAANIPSNYIEDEEIRLGMYKKVADIETEEMEEDLKEEFQDRFGEIPLETLNLMKISRIRYLSQYMDIKRVHEKNGEVFLYLNPKGSLSPYSVMMVKERYRDDVTFYGGRLPYFCIDVNKNKKLDLTLDVLEILKETKAASM